MTENPIHMVRFECDPDASSFLIDDFIPQYLINLQAWDHELHDGNDPPVLVGGGPDGDTVERYYANWWFDFDEDPDVFLANLWGYVPDHTEWALMRYHVCDHADDDRTGCAWDDDEERSHGDVPESIQ